MHTVLASFVSNPMMYDQKISKLSNNRINNFWRNEMISNVFNLDLCGHKTGVFNRSKIM